MFYVLGDLDEVSEHKPHLRLLASVLCTGNVLMLLNVTWRQHIKLTSNTAHTGHTRSLDTEHDSQFMHGDLDHGVCVHICKYARTLIIEQLII